MFQEETSVNLYAQFNKRMIVWYYILWSGYDTTYSLCKTTISKKK